MADNLQVSAKISEEKSVNILTLSVVRRDGAITPFKSDKISNAIKKAFLAQTKIRNDKNNQKYNLCHSQLLTLLNLHSPSPFCNILLLAIHHRINFLLL